MAGTPPQSGLHGDAPFSVNGCNIVTCTIIVNFLLFILCLFGLFKGLLLYAFKYGHFFCPSILFLSDKLCRLANQLVVGWLEGLWYPQPTRVQILMLAFIPEFISGFPAMRIQ